MATLVQLGFQPTTAVELAKKQQVLFDSLRGLSKVFIAYSGGTDLAYLARAAVQVLGQNAVAITADSASIPASHKRDAEAFALWSAITPSKHAGAGR